MITLVKDQLIVKFSSFFNKLPHKWGCWNCGMEKIPSGYIFTCRNETSKYNNDFFGRKTPSNVRWERYCPSLVYLDNDFRYLDSRPAKIINNELFEDVRIFSFNNHLFTTGTRKNKQVGKVDQFLAALEGDTLIMLPFKHEFHLHQKNWNTIIHNGQLYFEQSISRPRCIVKYTADGLKIVNESSYKNLPTLRGNCQTIEFHDYYLAVYHNHSFRRYYHFFALLDKKPPFKIIGITNQLRFQSAEASPIQFVTGITRECDDIIISFGRQDSDNYVSKIKLTQVLSLIKKV